ncbi:gfo/Idh/MocA family oxidoreductase [Paenibacillus psychroresistens]|uniref:Gfo/Idh/MocA family oxidoreductase n=1 Tax=Paenibacillus psychroresistens TaxID=1778678 RepID=A0A6B8REZ1_9BACL|nr:Gfo/Idh/MocA family oxidoreductase [Paenibacillus psychroresistens]QGQ93926.1 gfo/Idh/MocA family oxidoreductase [Paenibacillus psychroresistens]
MNIGIIGTGFGSYHAELLRKMDHVDRVVIFGRNETKLQTLKADLGIEVTNSIDDILLDPEITVVDICLPSHLHSQYAIEALKNGKHVFCETPVCLELEDALAMKQAEEQSGKRVLVNQFIKFEPSYTYLQETIQNQKYGKLLSLTLKRETSPMWGDLGLNTITTNLMIHELDFLTWLFGATNLSNVWGAEAEDKKQAHVRASYQHHGTFAEIIVSSRMPAAFPFTVSFEAYFEQAKLVFHESDARDPIQTALYEYTSSGQQMLALNSVNPYEKSLEHAVQCFHNNSESLISLDYAIASLKLAIELRERLY